MRGPLFADFLNEFSVNNSKGSLFFSLSSLVSLLGAMLAPMLIRRFGHLFSLWVFMAVMGIAFLGFSQGFNFEWMLFCGALFGIALGGLGVTQNLLVLQGSDESHRARAQSGLHSCYGASSLLAPGVVYAVSVLGLNWKTSFLIPAALSLLLVLVMTVFFRKFNEKPAISANQSHHQVRRPWQKAEIFWALLLSVYVALELMVSTRISHLLREGFGFDLAQTSLWTSVFFVGLFSGRVLYTIRPLQASLGLQLKLAMGLACVFLVLGLVHRPEWIALSGFPMAIFYPVWMTSLTRVFPDSLQRVASLGIGLTGVTVVFLHTVIGYFSDHNGLVTAYWVVPAVAGFATLMIVAFRPLFQAQLGFARMP